ncbi:hypothetical protein MJT46_005352 [Ovis ammon polii x Ovis aries]|nr:hypothetical protein MJT46_005352 [Ovis ammon polii x Ovis aries]
MRVKGMAIVLAVILCAAIVQGIPLSRNTRCTCIEISNGSVNPRSLEKLELIPASQSCPRVEIIATMKRNGEKRCLNPESKTIKNLLKAINKQRKVLTNRALKCSLFKGAAEVADSPNTATSGTRCSGCDGSFPTEGIPAIRNGRCSCINTSQGMIHPKSIKDLKQFAPSPTCEKIEIIATVKNGAQVCLNPDLPEVKELIKEWEKQVNQKKKQRKGKKYKKTKKVPKVKRSQRPSQKKTT